MFSEAGILPLVQRGCASPSGPAQGRFTCRTATLPTTTGPLKGQITQTGPPLLTNAEIPQQLFQSFGGVPLAGPVQDALLGCSPGVGADAIPPEA